MALVDVPRVGLSFIEITVQTEAEIPAHWAVQAKVGSFGRTFIFVLRSVEIGIPGTVPFVAAFFGDDIHHAASRAVAIACRGRTTQHFNALDHFWWDPGGIATGITLAAPALTYGVTAGNRFTIDQNQGVFWPHAANIDLAVVAALTAGGVTGQVNAWHGTDDFRHIAGGGILTNFISGNG